jgi:gamma-glutamylcyclotransferase (GGCT)/AIG2-like uncharacterized protein YtfP
LRTGNQSSLAEPLLHAVFVYGTLKRGECRARYWPHPPICVDSATVRGRLYDLGPYPALGQGDDVVRGEVWHLAPEHMAETLRVLDEVEGASQLKSAYYRRIVVACRLDDGSECQAWAYEFGDSNRLTAAQVVSPDERGECRWRGGTELEELE